MDEQEEIMLVNEVELDWLTLTSFDVDVYTRWRQYQEAYALEPLREERRMQYVGATGNSLFVGRGRQNEYRHHMLQASGAAATIVAPAIVHLPAKCTRIDLQTTVRLPGDFSAAYIATDIREWRGPGRPRTVTLVQSGDHRDTIYIGSRNSRRLIRLYIKPDWDGVPWLRLEVEYKRELADGAWSEYRSAVDKYDAMRALLAGEYDAVPGLADACGMAMKAVLRGDRGRPEGREITGESSTLRWLGRQVEPALVRAMHDHEHGEHVRQLVANWFAESRAIADKLAQFD